MGMSDQLVDFTERLNTLLGPDETLLAHCQVLPGGQAVGGRGSIAASFSRDGDLLVLSVSTGYLSFWDFGTTGTEQPSLTSQLPREYVASFADTGTPQGGAAFARMVFTDGSLFDWRLPSEPGPEFFAAAGF